MAGKYPLSPECFRGIPPFINLQKIIGAGDDEGMRQTEVYNIITSTPSSTYQAAALLLDQDPQQYNWRESRGF